MFNNNLGKLGNKNIAGIPKSPNNISGINKTPTNINGIQKMPIANNPFAKVKIDRQMSKQIMNSNGENVIRNEWNQGGMNRGN